MFVLITATTSYLAWRWRGERDQAVTHRALLREAAMRRARRPGQFEQNPADGLWYIRIPAGHFRMGCSTGDTACDPDEQPAHDVEITSAFWIGVTEVTQSAYERVTKTNTSLFRGSDLPAANMLWDQARQYCATISMRLPTEAEWEYAARAGQTQTRDRELGLVAWRGVKQPQPVGLLAPNAWGLHDMQGNVWEWVSDWYAAGYYATSPASDPSGPSSSPEQRKIARGGAWNSADRPLRLSNRGWGDFAGGDDSATGFRCAGDWHRAP